LLDFLPLLPRLQELDLHDTSIGDDDLDCLRGLAQLKALNLKGTSVTAEGLAKLIPLESLEELGIDERIATHEAMAELARLKRLATVYVEHSRYQRDRVGSLTLGNGNGSVASPGEPDAGPRTVRQRRQSDPEVIIDEDYDDFAARLDLEPPWLDGDRRKLDAFMQRWVYGR
jgi:hypothetical protein